MAEFFNCQKFTLQKATMENKNENGLRFVFLAKDPSKRQLWLRETTLFVHFPDHDGHSKERIENADPV